MSAGARRTSPKQGIFILKALRILVTGAAGFIGSHTVDYLLAAGHTVFGIDNFSTGCLGNLDDAVMNLRFRLCEGDVANQPMVEEIVSEFHPDAIVHLAALVSVPQSISDPELNYHLNVQATQIVAEASRRHRIKRVVFASSSAVYGSGVVQPIAETDRCEPISPYGAAKLASEAILHGHARTYGFVCRCQRYFNVYGPRQDPRSTYSGVISIFCAKLRSGQSPVVFGDGEQTRDFISVYDVARANVIAVTRPDIQSGVANICTGREVSINRLLTILRHHYPDAPPTQYTSERSGDIKKSCGSPAQAKQQLNFEAEIAMEYGVARVARWPAFSKEDIL